MTAQRDKRVMIGLFCLADGSSVGDLAGALLARYDPEGDDGHGRATWTMDPELALVFADVAEATELRRRVPANRAAAPGRQAEPPADHVRRRTRPGRGDLIRRALAK
jgi:hypothetical protein